MSFDIIKYYSTPVFFEFYLNFENLEIKDKAISILKNFSVENFVDKIKQSIPDNLNLQDSVKFCLPYLSLYDFIQHFKINDIEKNENYISLTAEYDYLIKYQIHETIPATYDSPEEPGSIEILENLTKEQLEKDMKTFLHYINLEDLCISFELIDENLKSEDELLELISEDLYNESLEY